jgi:hypothetical protein
MPIVNTLVPSQDKDANMFAIGTISADGNYQVVEDYMNGNVKHRWFNNNAGTGTGTVGVGGVGNGVVKGSVIGTKLVLDKENGTVLTVELGELVNKGVIEGRYNEVAETIEVILLDGKVISIPLMGLKQTVVDSLSNTSVVYSLSANQGKILNEAIVGLAGSVIGTGKIAGNNLELIAKDGRKVVIDVTSLLADVKLGTARYESGTKSLVFELTDGSKLEVPVSELVPVSTDVTLKGDGSVSPLSVDIEELKKHFVDIKLESGRYEEGNKQLSLTMSDGTVVGVPVGSLSENTKIVSGIFNKVTSQIEINNNDGSIVNIDVGELTNDSTVMSGEYNIDNKSIELLMTDSTIIAIDVEEITKDQKVESGKYNEVTKKIELTLTDNTVVEIDVNPLDSKVASGVYNQSNKEIELSINDGSKIVIEVKELAEDVKLSNGIYNETTKALELGLNDGTIVNVPVGKLSERIYLSSGTYNEVTKNVDLLMTNGMTLKVPVGSLADDTKLISAAYNVGNTELDLTLSDGVVVKVPLTGLTKPIEDNQIVSGSISGTKLELRQNKGTSIEIDVSQLLVNVTLVDGKYNQGTNALDLTLSDGKVISIPVEHLLPVTTDKTLVGNGNSLPLGVNVAELKTLLTDLRLSSGVYNVGTKSIDLTMNDGTIVNVVLSGLYTALDNNKIVSGGIVNDTLNLVDNTGKVTPINIAALLKDTKVVSGVYNELTKDIEITLSDSVVVKIAADKIGNVEISGDANNILRVGTDGKIYAPKSKLISGAVAGNKLNLTLESGEIIEIDATTLVKDSKPILMQFDNSTALLKIINNDTTNISISLISLLNQKIASGAVVGNNLTLTTLGGGTITIDATALIKDTKLSSGSYNTTLKALELNQSDGTVVSVPLTISNSAIVRDNTLKGTGVTGQALGVAISTDGENKIELGSDGGIYVHEGAEISGLSLKNHPLYDNDVYLGQTQGVGIDLSTTNRGTLKVDLTALTNVMNVRGSMGDPLTGEIDILKNDRVLVCGSGSTVNTTGTFKRGQVVTVKNGSGLTGKVTIAAPIDNKNIEYILGVPCQAVTLMYDGSGWIVID